MPRTVRRVSQRTLLLAALVAFGLMQLFPLVWVGSYSLQRSGDLFVGREAPLVGLPARDLLTRQPIEPALWMPTAVRLSGEGRAVLQLRKLEVDFAVDWFDYQRFDGRVPIAP